MSVEFENRTEGCVNTLVISEHGGSHYVTYTYGPTALITSRGKDNKYGPDELRAIARACNDAAELIEVEGRQE